MLMKDQIYIDNILKEMIVDKITRDMKEQQYAEKEK